MWSGQWCLHAFIKTDGKALILNVTYSFPVHQLLTEQICSKHLSVSAVTEHMALLTTVFVSCSVFEGLSLCL